MAKDKTFQRNHWYGRKRHWSLHLMWEQWALPLSIWWWSNDKDRAWGVQILALQIHWEKYPRRW